MASSVIGWWGSTTRPLFPHWIVDATVDHHFVGATVDMSRDRMKRVSFIVEDVADRSFREHEERQDAVGDSTFVCSMIMAAPKAASVFAAPT